MKQRQRYYLSAGKILFLGSVMVPALLLVRCVDAGTSDHRYKNGEHVELWVNKVSLPPAAGLVFSSSFSPRVSGFVLIFEENASRRTLSVTFRITVPDGHNSCGRPTAGLGLPFGQDNKLLGVGVVDRLFLRSSLFYFKLPHLAHFKKYMRTFSCSIPPLTINCDLPISLPPSRAGRPVREPAGGVRVLHVTVLRAPDEAPPGHRGREVQRVQVAEHRRVPGGTRPAALRARRDVRQDEEDGNVRQVGPIGERGREIHAGDPAPVVLPDVPGRPSRLGDGRGAPAREQRQGG